MKGSMDTIILLYYHMQMIIYHPTYKTNMPPNTLIYFDELRGLVNAEKLNADTILNLF